MLLINMRLSLSHLTRTHMLRGPLSQSFAKLWARAAQMANVQQLTRRDQDFSLISNPELNSKTGAGDAGENLESSSDQLGPRRHHGRHLRVDAEFDLRRGDLEPLKVRELKFLHSSWIFKPLLPSCCHPWWSKGVVGEREVGMERGLTANKRIGGRGRQ